MSHSRGRGNGRRRGPGAGVRKVASKRSALTNGRRGRSKRYTDARVQAAYERQRDLKSNYSLVATALKPILDELAARNIKKMKEDALYHQQVSESYKPLRDQLDRILANRISEEDRILSTRLAHLKKHKEMFDEITKRSFEVRSFGDFDGFCFDIDIFISRFVTDNRLHHVLVSRRPLTFFLRQNQWEELQEEFLDGQRNKLNKLSLLRRFDLPLDVSSSVHSMERRVPGRSLLTLAQLPDTSYEFRLLSEWDARNWAPPYFYLHNDHEVPFPAVAGFDQDFLYRRSAAESSKHPADDATDGQSAVKRVNTSGSEARHIAGILSAVAPPAEEPLSPIDELKGASAAPSPAAEAQDGVDNLDAESTEQRASKPRPQDALPPLPAGASEPDAYGVRTVRKRNQGEAHNRLVFPCIYEFDEMEIGFRDSTNDSSKGATLAKRGKFLNTPNSRNFHFDPLIKGFNLTQQEENDLDEEVVRKHKLHPRYGVFLADSENEAEPPKSAPKCKPVVFVGQDGIARHTSRSVPRMRLLDSLKEDDAREKLAFLVAKEVDESKIDPALIRPDYEEIQGYLKSGYQWPTSDVRSEQTESATATPPAPDQPAADKVEEGVTESDERSEPASGLLALLEAADVTAAEPETREQPVAPAAPMQRQQSTRPYDAVRDIFASERSSYPPPATPYVGYRGQDALSMLADVVCAEPDTAAPYSHYNQQTPYQPTSARVGMSPTGPESQIDPQLLAMERPVQMMQDQSPYHQAQHPIQHTGYQSIAPARQHTAHSIQSPPALFPPYMSPSRSEPMPLAPDLPAPYPSGRPAQRPLLPNGPLPGAAEPHYHPSDQMHRVAQPSYPVSNGTGYYPQHGLPRPYHSASHPPEPPSMLPGQSMPGQPVLAPAPRIEGPYGMHPSMQMPQQTIQPGTYEVNYHPGLQTPGAPPPAPPLPPPGPSGPQRPFARGEFINATPQSMTAPKKGRGSVSSPTKLRKLEPAPTPDHRKQPPPPPPPKADLKTVPWDYRESIKDYAAVEDPPSHAPKSIRGWSHNNTKFPMGRPQFAKDDTKRELLP